MQRRLRLSYLIKRLIMHLEVDAPRLSVYAILTASMESAITDYAAAMRSILGLPVMIVCSLSSFIY